MLGIKVHNKLSQLEIHTTAFQFHDDVPANIVA